MQAVGHMTRRSLTRGTVRSARNTFSIRNSPLSIFSQEEMRFSLCLKMENGELKMENCA
jgi:hypothetical protein